ncbi:hypothetical protein [Crystallibacter degradans]|uniref:hypothetical protein n=1 Tax=Crystallibacter degradans TaxID=2726743 RepID=UPI001F0D2E62|nr:hypothetical protein [Arthrobacter sp. SF27]
MSTSAKIPHPAVPVFFDPSGKRWRRVMLVLTALLVAMAGTVAFVTPSALAPTWTPPENQSASYPRELLASWDEENIPLIGEETGFAFVRVDTVERIGGKVMLTDPFSDKVFREAAPAEAEEIGHAPYTVERFGTPAEKQLMLTFDDGPSA